MRFPDWLTKSSNFLERRSPIPRANENEPQRENLWPCRGHVAFVSSSRHSLLVKLVNYHSACGFMYISDIRIFYIHMYVYRKRTSNLREYTSRCDRHPRILHDDIPIIPKYADIFDANDKDSAEPGAFLVGERRMPASSSAR